MLIYIPLQRRSATVVEVRLAPVHGAVRRRSGCCSRRPTSCCPCSATLRLQPALATRPASAARSPTTAWVIHNGDFWHTIKISFVLALETIVISLILFVPTIYWVHLKVPRLRPVIAFLALIPFVVPPIVMVVGLLQGLQGHAELVLRAAVGLPRSRLRDPRVPVHVLLARRRLPLDRRAHADRGVAEPRRELADVRSSA